MITLINKSQIVPTFGSDSTLTHPQKNDHELTHDSIRVKKKEIEMYDWTRIQHLIDEDFEKHNCDPTFRVQLEKKLIAKIEVEKNNTQKKLTVTKI